MSAHERSSPTGDPRAASWEVELDRLAESLLERHRRGEHPSIDEYAERHPELAERIRRFFPALVLLEEARGSPSASGDPAGPAAAATGVEGEPPRRLGEYRIVREVGRGGMGVVYEAVQESLGRHVALKILPAAAVVDPRHLERFRREAKAAARLHHTNIVPVFGVGEADGRHFYAMQFISGHPLDAVIDEVRRLKGEPAQVGEAGVDVEGAHRHAPPLQLLPQQRRAQAAGIGERGDDVSQRLKCGPVEKVLLVFV